MPWTDLESSPLETTSSNYSDSVSDVSEDSPAASPKFKLDSLLQLHCWRPCPPPSRIPSGSAKCAEAISRRASNATCSAISRCNDRRGIKKEYRLIPRRRQARNSPRRIQYRSPLHHRSKACNHSTCQKLSGLAAPLRRTRSADPLSRDSSHSSSTWLATTGPDSPRSRAHDSDCHEAMERIVRQAVASIRAERQVILQRLEQVDAQIKNLKKRVEMSNRQ